MTSLGSNLDNKWYSPTDAGCERLARYIAEAFADVAYVSLNDIDRIPSVEFALRNDQGLLTPERILELGRRLKEVADEHPVLFHQAGGRDVTFLVLHTYMRDGRSFNEELVNDYGGIPLDELEKAWTRSTST
jgi:hypothetical protein